MIYFIPNYIRDLEKKNGNFSVLEIPFMGSNFENFLREKKLKVVYEKVKIDKEDKLIKLETLFETKQNFLIHFNSEVSESINIYYKPEQFNELIITIKQLKKQFKNGTTDN